MLRRRDMIWGGGAALFAPSGVRAWKSAARYQLAEFRRSGEGWTETWQRALGELEPGDELILPSTVMMLEAPLVIAVDSIRVTGVPGAVLRAAPDTSFEYLLSAERRRGLKIDTIAIDANGMARRRGQRHRFMGLGLVGCAGCSVTSIEAQGTLGFDGVPAAAIAIAGEGRGVDVSNVVLTDCGTPEQPSDGLYMSGDDHRALNVKARGVTDTALVIEACNGARAHGIEVRDSSAAAAVTNITASPKRDNAITGLVGRNLNAPVTGWVQVGCPLPRAGDLLGTRLELDLSSQAGPGPGVNIRHSGAGRACGVFIKGTVVGPTAQGVLVDGANVSIEVEVQRPGGAAIQFQPGATGRIDRSRLVGGTFGVLVSGGATVSMAGNSYEGQQFWNMYVYGDGRASSHGDRFGAAGINHHGHEAEGSLLIR